MSDRQIPRIRSIGIDGGGSGTLVAFCDGDSEPQYIGVEQTLKYTDISVKLSAERIANIIHSLSKTENVERINISISLSGASNVRNNAEFVSIFSEKFPTQEIHCHIESDSTYTLRAAYQNTQSGYLIIAGTGSVVLARDQAGNIYKAGGWGRLLGDEGSGYWIGLQALKYYVNVLDDPSLQFELFDAVRSAIEEKCGTTDFSIIRAALYSNQLNPSKFCPLVFESNDRVAEEILTRGAEALARNVRLLTRKSTMPIASVVTLHGSVAVQDKYKKLFEQLLPEINDRRMLSREDVASFVLSEAKNL